MSFEILGDPPRLVRATWALTADDVRSSLSGESLEHLLAHLGIDGRDAAELRPLVPLALADAEILDEVTSVANALRAGAGVDAEEVDLVTGAPARDALQRRIAPGEGLIAILALMAGTGTVRAWHAARGIEDALSWEVLSDLGQQMRVHRASSGLLGLHQLHWAASTTWRGVLIHLGRLQFDLHRTAIGTAQERWVIGTHIPARGGLDPLAVEESFEAATEFFTTRFADLARESPAGVPAFGREFECDSWLVNPLLTEHLGVGSNLGAFAARWELRSSAPGADAAAFFVFGARPPYDAAALPRRTRLERLVGERLADGRGWETGVGTLVR